MSLGIVFEVWFNNWFIFVWVIYAVLPILDYIMPLDQTNIEAERKRTVEKSSKFLVPLYAHWLLDFGVLYWVLYRISQGEICQTLSSFVTYAVIISQIAGLNAVVGHELLHRRQIIHKVAGTMAYFKMLYA